MLTVSIHYVNKYIYFSITINSIIVYSKITKNNNQYKKKEGEIGQCLKKVLTKKVKH
jgi:hypothetical protein